MKIIALYNSLVFRSLYGESKFDTLSVFFIGTFFGTENEFIKRYKKMFPNYSIQIFRGRKSPLLKSMRIKIENLIKIDPRISQQYRDIKISNLFDIN